MSVLVSMTSGSAWNILRHLQNLEDRLEVENPNNLDEGTEALTTLTIKDIQAEITGMKRSILISLAGSEDTGFVGHVKTLMHEYRHVMGDETPEITNVEDDLKRLSS